MRTILTQHDSTRAREGNSFDLNNPPRKPYSHQEWPRLVYNHESRQYATVDSVEEMEQYLASGWSKEPFEAQYPAPSLSAQDQAEVERLERLIDEARRKKKVA